ncbi:MAG: mannose-phosphate guanylyltransferase [Acidimicrobiaceae bacterium]
MKAVVLVGGFGTRLRPLTLHTPKQMLPVVDRPMIEWVVGHLGRHGIDHAVLSLGYRPDAFADAYPDGRCAGVELQYAVEDEPLDTAGAIRFAAECAGIRDRFVVMNGDALTDLDITALVAFHDRAGAEATIALHEVPDPSRYGVVATDDDGRVIAFVEKPPADAAPSNFINAGTYVLEPSVLDRIDRGRSVSIERETFPSMVGDRSLFAMPDGGVYWLDAGTPESYLQAQLDLIEGERALPAGISLTAVDPSAVVSSTASVRSSVLGPDVRVDDDAEVVGSFVQRGAVIEAKARVRDSIIGPGASIGEGASVESLSVVGDGQRVAAGADLQSTSVPVSDP